MALRFRRPPGLINPKGGSIPRFLPNTRPGVNDKRENEIVQQILTATNFPGQQSGASIDAVRQFIRNQARKKGFRLSGGIGTQEFPIQISGSAKFLLGHLLALNFNADLTLNVNDEIVEQQVPANALVPASNPRGTTDWFIINRPLSGADTITLTVKAFAAYQDVPYIIYYI